MKTFDPNNIGAANDKIFGFPYELEDADVYILPVPWEVTVSYGSGTAKGPEAILKASPQLDFYDPDIENAWETKIFMEEIPGEWLKENKKLRPKVVQYIEKLEKGADIEDPALKKIRQAINDASAELNEWVYLKMANAIEQGHAVGLLGGDHSTPFGFIKALAEHHDKFGILQIDAHADLREAYEGFEYSHASIMYNALRIQEVRNLVQVGIRDISPAEVEFINKAKGKIHTFYDSDLKKAQYQGDLWHKLCDKIIEPLPEKVYISFDIDGLDPKYCPNTGTPVPGGLQFDEAVYLLNRLLKSGRTIIGFDLCEVAPGENEWNANVGARMLYKLCNFMWKSNCG